ncbi:hypothetical protein SUGI_1167390 [Cryptomeria japonica]|nr:hypothetical protein SUGI_1167390 [Cryptomeria japonica]
MKEDHHHVYHRRRPTCTVTAILTAIAYTLGVITSPLVQSHDATAKPAGPVTSPVTSLMVVQQQQNQNSRQQTGDLTRFDAHCAEPVASKEVRKTIIDGLFNGTSPFDGFPPEHVKPFLRTKRVKGWGSTGTVFQRLINEVKPRIVVELGTFLGASALHMATVARDQGLKTQILCIDDFRGWPGFRQKFKDVGLVNGDVTLLYQFMQNVVYMNLTAAILPLPFSTVSMVRKLCEFGVYADLIEVDAAHDFLSAWADINTAYAVLRHGGVMFGHDYHTKLDNSGVRRAVNLFAKVKGLTVECDGEHWILRPRGNSL